MSPGRGRSTCTCGLLCPRGKSFSTLIACIVYILIVQPYVFISGETATVCLTICCSVYVGPGVPRRGAPVPVFHAVIRVEFGFIDCGGEVLDLKRVERLAIVYL